jgi:hypothetical protein
MNATTQDPMSEPGLCWLCRRSKGARDPCPALPTRLQSRDQCLTLSTRLRLRNQCLALSTRLQSRDN